MATLNTNVTTSSGLSPTMQTFYDRRLLEVAKPKLVHQQHGQKRPIPRHGGKTIQFRKWTPFAPATTPLTEGTPPDGQDLNQTELIATVKQQGAYVSVSDFLDMTALDPVVHDAIELMGDQGGLTLDVITRDIITAGTNVQYANGKTSRDAVAAADKLTTTEIRKAVRTLKKNKARPFMRNGKGYFYSIVGPDATFDLQSDPLWQGVGQYQQAEKIESGEIGRLFGVIFLETTEAKVFAGAGASNVDVHGTIVFGQDAYGVISIDNNSLKSFVKPAGSAGTADPLNQVSTIGWKAPAYTAAILQPLWLVRIEHGVTA